MLKTDKWAAMIDADIEEKIARQQGLPARMTHDERLVLIYAPLPIIRIAGLPYAGAGCYSGHKAPSLHELDGDFS